MTSEEKRPPSRGIGKKLGRAAAYPLIRLLEPRFQDLARRIVVNETAVHDEAADTRAAIEQMMASYAGASGESLTFVGTQLRDLTDELRAQASRAADGAAAEAADGGDAAPVAPATHHDTTVEQPFAMRALANLSPPARVLDVHGAEHTLGLVLATLGFEVTGVDPRPYAHEHPGLEMQVTTLEQLEPDEPFAAACCLSGLASAGADAEDPWAADRVALTHLRTLLADPGLVVLALPMGAGVEGGRANYDEPRIEQLLDDWREHERLYVREALPGTWISVAAPEGRCVALVAASTA